MRVRDVVKMVEKPVGPEIFIGLGLNSRRGNR